MLCEKVSLSPLIIFGEKFIYEDTWNRPRLCNNRLWNHRFFGGKYKTLSYGAITTSSDTPFTKRLELIYDELELVIAKTKPQVAAIERLYFQNNQKTAIDVAQARGVIMLALQKANCLFLSILHFR